MKKTHLAALLVAGISVSAAVACSSSDDSNAPTDTGSDAGVDSAADVVEADGSQVAADAGSDAAANGDANTAPDYCAIQAAFTARCSDAGTTDSGAVSAACAQALHDQCEQNSALDSKILHDVTVNCQSATSSCANAQANDSCSTALFETAQPTLAQSATRDHACTLCASGDANELARCQREFFYAADAGGIGLGFVVFASNDTLATQMDTTCVSGMTNTDPTDLCLSYFAQCASQVRNDAQTDNPAACTAADAGTD